jgi:hypothetical protein
MMMKMKMVVVVVVEMKGGEGERERESRSHLGRGTKSEQGLSDMRSSAPSCCSAVITIIIIITPTALCSCVQVAAVTLLCSPLLSYPAHPAPVLAIHTLPAVSHVVIILILLLPSQR